MEPPSGGSPQGPVPGQPQVLPARDLSFTAAAVSDGGVQAPSSPQPRQASLSARAASATQANAFHWPEPGSATSENMSEYRELSDVITRTRPDVVRQVVRDLWETCLLGSEYHLAFVVNATFPQAVQDLGHRMLRPVKQQFIGQLTRQDLDELADLIYAKVSNDFLDKGMAKRLETIRARPLVNALARAERLGYSVRDIVEEETADGVERVVPSLHSITGLAHPSQPVPSQPVPSQHYTAAPTTSPQRQGSNSNSPAPAGLFGLHGIVHCPLCRRPCSGPRALEYHSTRRACEHTHYKYDRIGRDICPHCGSLFGTSGGLLYHLAMKVCGDYDAVTEQTVLAELRANFLQPSNAFVRRLPPQMTGIPTPTQTQHKTPGQTVAAATNRTTPDFTTPSGGFNILKDDPYEKLTPQEKLNFEADMMKAEERYGSLMQAAMELPPAEREVKLAKLKNSYCTKQSMTRKKHGIRLRETRSKEEVEAERSRRDSAGRSSSNTAGHGPTQKRACTGSDAQASSTQQPGYPDGGGPGKRPALADLRGGLTGVPATAEPTNPWTSLTASKLRSMAQVAQPRAAARRGTSDDPMQIDDSSRSDGSSSDSDDDDIPAQLQAHKT
ncbi:Uncharacterized protein TCAP_04311 [Tolypocladium capitatum]|uniref:Uncharacterized protein n=1 Tax=Tolypocladium capitatum TaxID=45235 RepID=A0A2K3QE10_9HYPO|nr:Uncharacterized protein TCAP_04311 [Tolypocladium capitatum]